MSQPSAWYKHHETGPLRALHLGYKYLGTHINQTEADLKG
jgi:hypothetical protein